jgi:hypothetical protein
MSRAWESLAGNVPHWVTVTTKKPLKRVIASRTFVGRRDRPPRRSLQPSATEVGSCALRSSADRSMAAAQVKSSPAASVPRRRPTTAPQKELPGEHAALGDRLHRDPASASAVLCLRHADGTNE